MSKSFTSNDKLADIVAETTTLLVESTDSSCKDVCATRLCETRRFSRCKTFVQVDCVRLVDSFLQDADGTIS